ncbi:hypothetical protein LTR91_004162 [Friedmanniomyces endolithicus]|uniref:DUF2415 domain-containing protein n=1 Tax=Friedmanniomyces endolithicus TaxID=329885 RepID=A0AAN6QZ88_9PEZI|nr:hypothetical protein LTR57_002394 [Friedmanniomyces endolithicus]KAK1005150.1 hypothetical protein LTS01_003515 [Friedmanniomyces endolithicus]KAK1005305.1 hypothetical protein LTR91_004162 [Friedmanniomyces endolithicus]KAK1037468.1 hypothetical protein LTS16_012854 [Friedmanniomyces endolithicus]
MAIDTIPYRDADNLAHAQKAFYPVNIPVTHWQLRHYISTPEPDLLYYASAHDIYCLNTASKKRKHVATLPFEARCTASGYGWVCVGGEDEGHFAAIKLDGHGARSTQDEEGTSQGEPWRQGTARTTGRTAASVKVERIGEEIVNSISIHRIQDESAHLDDIVAVLTNNDKTVRVYSLPQSLETTVLDLPFAMNHATISPDGQTLVAVGDFNQAYLFQRELQVAPPQIPKPHNRLTSASIDWTLTNVVALHASDSTAGYFTTAWSETGHLVAVGSEGGYVTVLDMEMLASPDYDDEDAVVAVVPGSRPEGLNYPGAVRTMAFAPDPWDLLIWAEDRGRVCIGDLRTGLKTKQVVNLDPKDDKLRKLDYEDVPVEGGARPIRGIDDLEADFLRRYRHAPDNATAVDFATEYIEARRRQRQQRQDMAALRSVANSAGVSALEDDPHGLTAREQQILESLRTTRQREEARSNGGGSGHIPRSVNYTNADMFPGIGGTVTGQQWALGEILSPVPDSFPELSRTTVGPRSAAQRHAGQTQVLPSLDDLQDHFMNLRSTLSRGADAPSRLPRRRATVVMPPPGATTATRSSRPALVAPAAAAPAAAPAPSTSPNATASDDENPWRTIEAHMTLARGPLFESAARADAAPPLPATTATPASGPTTPAPSLPSPSPGSLERELAVELAAEQARARSLARQRDRYRALRTQASGNITAVAEANAAAAGTAGLVGEGSASGDGGGGEEGAQTRLPPTAIATARRGGRTVPGFPEGYEMLLRRSQVRGAGIGVGGGGGGGVGGAGGSGNGVRTAGLALSADGRTLWAACEEGIFEVPLNLKGRMFWPSVEVR